MTAITLPPPTPIDPGIKQAFAEMFADRAARSAELSFNLNQIRQNPADVSGNNLLLANAQQQAGWLSGAGGLNLTSQIGNVATKYATGPWTPSLDKAIGALSDQTAKPMAGVLATGQQSQWDQLISKMNTAPAPTASWQAAGSLLGLPNPVLSPPKPAPDWSGLLTNWSSSGRPLPTVSSQPDLTSLFAGQSGRDTAFTSILDLPAPASGQPGAPLQDLFQMSHGAVQTLGLPAPVFGGGGVSMSPTAVARRQLGQPYVWGGESRKEGGFDCSGLLQWSFGRSGIDLNRTTWQQVQQGRHVGWNAMKPGDAIYYDMNGGQRDANHCGLYIGNGKMIAASTGAGKVVIQDLNPWWRDRLVDVRRFGH
jgi:hypothetical protein